MTDEELVKKHGIRKTCDKCAYRMYPTSKLTGEGVVHECRCYLEKGYYLHPQFGECPKGKWKLSSFIRKCCEDSNSTETENKELY